MLDALAVTMFDDRGWDTCRHSVIGVRNYMDDGCHEQGKVKKKLMRTEFQCCLDDLAKGMLYFVRRWQRCQRRTIAGRMLSDRGREHRRLAK